MYLLVSPHDLKYAVFGLVKNTGDVIEVVKMEKIETTPEMISDTLLTFLQREQREPQDLEGVIVVTGPGSFTSLRAGLSALNTLAFVHELPLIPVSNPEQMEIIELISTLNLSSRETCITPFYGREPRVTVSKK